MKYEVRIKPWESRRWKTVAKFNCFSEAEKYAIQLDHKNRKSVEDEFTKIDIKNIKTKERFMVADW